MKRIVLCVLPLLWAGCGEEVTPPARTVPVITSPRSGSVSSRLKITVRGNAEPDQALEVFVDSEASPVLAHSTEAGEFEALDVPLGGQGGRVIWARMVQDTSRVSAPVVLTMSYEDLATPVVLFPVHGVAIPAGAVPVAGRAPLGVTEVEIYRDGALSAMVPVRDGGFILPTLDPSGSGWVQLWVRGVTEWGGYTAESESITVMLGGGQRPMVETVESPAADTVVNAREVLVQGRAAATDSLALFVDGGDTGHRAFPSGGAFSLGPAALVDEGPHIVGIVSLHTEGNVAEDAIRLWVDRTAPSAPVIIRPGQNELYRHPEITVEGATEADAQVEVAVDGEWRVALTADSAGAFSAGLVLPGDGIYRLSARATDGAGNTGAESSERSVVIDAAAPAAPCLNEPLEGALVIEETLMVSGGGQSGSWVEILIDGNAAEGFVTGDLFGVTMPTPRPDGAHTISVRGASAPGQGWVRGDSVGISVDLTPPPSPVILQPPDSAVLAVSLIPVAGAAEPGATVTVYSGEEEMGQALTDASGAWAMTIGAPDVDGAVVVHGTAVDSAGHASNPGTPHVFIMDRIAPALTITAPEPGELFSANPVMVSGETEPGAAVTVDGVEASVEGMSFMAVAFLAEGPDTLVVAARDGPGNTTLIRLPLSLDTMPPFISLTGPPDSLITENSSVMVMGTTEIGSNVTIQGSPVSVDGAGAFNGVVSLPQGWTTITVMATDRAGWTAREDRHVVRDAVPTAPNALQPDGGTPVTVGKPPLTMTGAVDPNGDELLYSVEVYADALLAQRVAQSPPLAEVAGTVLWIVAPEMNLSGGTRYWRARAFDGLLWGPWSSVATFRLPDIGSRDPHRLLGFGDSITAGAQGIPSGNGTTIWIWMSEGYVGELESALTQFLLTTVAVDYEYVPAGSSAMGLEEIAPLLEGANAGYLLLLFGTIDAKDAISPSETVANLAAMVSEARARNMIVILGTVPPRIPPEECGYENWVDPAANSRVIALNQAIGAYAQAESIPLADHYTVLYETAQAMGPPLPPNQFRNRLFNVLSLDGIHPNGLGYSLMAREWCATIIGAEGYVPSGYPPAASAPGVPEGAVLMDARTVFDRSP
ncbi:hypothetical protein JXA88_14895 [Candidatus Fermentibacteria bacterium]|nr:hypothetical protein [Candidatus Fermentibacteria bacterium]